MSRLTEREWTVLSALWETDDAELGVLVERLRPGTGWSRNTVLTYLTRMEAKGLVSIEKQTTPHRYRAALDRAACQAQERHNFLQRVYQGAAGDMITAFLRDEPISAGERERLRQLLDEMEV